MLAHNLNREVDDLRCLNWNHIQRHFERVQERPFACPRRNRRRTYPHALGNARDYSFYDLKGVLEQLLAGL